MENRVAAEEEPTTESEYRREDEEPKVGLEEGEVEADLLSMLVTETHSGGVCSTYAFSKLVPDLIQVFLRQKCLLAPFSDPSLVSLLVVKGEDGLHVFPLPMLGCNACTSFMRGESNHVANDSQSFGLSFGVQVDRIGGFWFSIANSVEPVAHSVSMALA